MVSIFTMASQVYKNEGPRALLGSAFQYAGRRITENDRRKKREEIIENYSEDTRYLNVGGTYTLRDDWRILNYIRGDHHLYDYHPDFVDFNVDLEEREQWPIESDSYDIVYSSATLEHLTQRSARHVMEESKRILKPNGGLHITVPDAELAIEKYEDGDEEWMVDIFGLTDEQSFHRDCPDAYVPEYFLMKFFSATHIKKEKSHQEDFESFLQGVRGAWDSMDEREFLDKYTSMVDDDIHSKYPGSHRNWFDSGKLKSMMEGAGFEETERVYTRQSRFTELCHDEFDKRPAFFVQVEGITPGSSGD